jgi:hypothetical protein
MQKLKLAVIVALASIFYVPVANAAVVTTTCGPLLKSVSKTNIQFFSSSSELPVNIPGGVTVKVPSGETRCIRVRFSAVANCPNSCFIRAIAGTNELNPAWVSNPLRFSSDATGDGTAHSFEWVERVGTGEYVVKISFQTGNSSFVADIGPYTLTVETLE